MANGFQPFDSSIGYAHKLGLQYDVGVINRAISGNSVQNQGYTQTANLTGIGIVPSKLFIMYGTNDMGPAGNGSTPTAQFKADFVTMLNDLLAAPGWGATQVYVIGILPRVNFSAGTITAWNGLGNGIQGAIAACKDPGRATFVDPTDWGFTGPSNNDYSTYYTTDGAANGLHPNAAGFNLMVSRLAPYLAPKAATSSFVGTDSKTQGNWAGVYGADGYDLFGGAAQLPAYAQLSTSGAQTRLWGTSTSDARDLLDSPTATTRTAASLYSPTSLTLDLNLIDGKTQQVALYFLDWDNQSRNEKVQVTDAASGAVLDTRTLSNFGNGQWLAWDLSGRVKITITDIAGPDAVVSGMLFDPMAQKSAAATFVRNDSATQGNWIGAYGADGYDIVGGAFNLPSYARLAAAGQGYWLWSESETKAKDLELPASGGTTRIAACDYTATSCTLDLNLTDGNAHQVALYLLDWESAGRKETVQVSDAASGAVLDTEQVSNFSGGQYLVWNLSGHVTITITDTGPGNAVLSGLMFDPAAAVTAPTATAKYVTTNTTTGGTWTGVYGADGYSVVAGQTSLPAYASLTTTGASTYTWSTSATDTRNLQVSPGASSRVGACDVSATSFTFDLNLTDGNAHQVGLYALNWDSWTYRNETITISDATTGAVLDTRAVTNFGNGEWLVWDLSGHVKITVTNNGGMNAVVSGIFFDPIPSAVPPPPPPGSAASFVANDATTEGTWTNVYGGDGYSIMGGATSLPSYAQLSVANAQSWTWAAAGATSDLRDLQTAAGAATRIAACDVSATSFTFDLNLTDGKAHQVELYALNWDSWSYRNETFTITDATGGAVLDTRTVGNFGNGQWLVWNLSGHVKITVTNNGGMNAVVSGLFFGGAPATASATAQYVKTDTTTAGTWTGAYGGDGYSIFNGATSLPSYAQLSAANAQSWTWAAAGATSDLRDLQTAPGAATRIAACDTSATSFTLDLNLADGKAHPVALYALNWDSWTYRNETIIITDANTGAVLDTRNIANFNNGQWLAWNMSGHVKITVTNNGGANAVLSGIFFG
jgi:lysophospholipase L1-like esterase